MDDPLAVQLRGKDTYIVYNIVSYFSNGFDLKYFGKYLLKPFVRSMMWKGSIDNNIFCFNLPISFFSNTQLKSRNVSDADSPRLLTTMAFKLKSLLQTEFRNGFKA